VKLYFWLGLILSLLFSAQPELKKTKNRAEFQPEPYSSAGTIRFANRITVDINQPPVADFSNFRYYLIHLSQPVRQNWLAQLKKLHFTPIGYLAYQTVIARFDPLSDTGGVEISAGQIEEKIAAIKKILPVDWLGPFLPEFKLAPELRRRKKAEELVVAFWEKGPALNFSCYDYHSCIRLLDSLQNDESVSWIQTRSRFSLFNRNVQWVLQTGWDSVVPDPIQGRRIWSKGITGQGMIVGLFDSGINTEHDMFYDPFVPISAPGIYPEHRKIVAYKLYHNAAFGDASATGYHGSAVAGTLAGNDSVNGNLSQFDGIAPKARIYFLDIGTASGGYEISDDFTELLDSVRLSRGLPEPVRQVSGSFGTMDFLSYYRLADATVDAVCWQDKSFLVIWAAGNAGGVRYRLGHPSCAKNALTVGGTGNGIRANRPYSASSAGPTRDERIKPNLVAPAESIYTVYGGGINAYRLREGTSFASPAVSGALTLLRQYLKEGWYPSGEPDPHRSIDNPSSALLRALAICATDTNVLPETIPDNRIGWGRLNLSRIMHFPDHPVYWAFVDETTGLATGEYDEYEFRVESRQPLSVVLTWTDTAGAPNAEIAIVNDLNLELESPDLNRYRGNQFIRGQSVPNPTNWDERNVEEVIIINRPLTGTWKARIYARNVFTALQPYALVIKGPVVNAPALTEAPPILKPKYYSNKIVNGHKTAITIPARNRLRVWSIDGTLVAELSASTETPRLWHLTGNNRKKLPAGVYLYQLIGDRGIQTGRITLIK